MEFGKKKNTGQRTCVLKSWDQDTILTAKSWDQNTIKKKKKAILLNNFKKKTF